MPPPKTLWTFTPKIFLQVRPYVHRYLRGWREQAERIPSPELRRQALASITAKTFHCEGGAIYALLAGERYRETIRFIIAYQTISDYLDNLCDRSTSLNPDDFRHLHRAMHHALTPGAAATNYYRFRADQDDGGYLSSLVLTCQGFLTCLPHYRTIARILHELADYYGDLQVFKHVYKEERLALIKGWFEGKKDGMPPMEWFEFAACCGSTIGIFAIVSQAAHPGCTDLPAKSIRDAYFPWVQGLHILLDYLIDQDEDSAGGDLNFCSSYKDSREMVSRLSHFYRQATASVSALPHAKFHRMVNQGILGMYCSDRKVYRQEEVKKVARAMIRLGGGTAMFFYCLCWFYRRIASIRP